MTMSSHVLRSVFEYESNDNKVLNFKVNERFVVIKEIKPNDWVYCVNSLGQLGYVPKDYVTEEQRMREKEFLSLIDSIAQQLDSKHNDTNVITDRQVKHAQIKLAQIRCEVVQLIFKKKTPQVIQEVDTNGSEYDGSPEQNDKQIIDKITDNSNTNKAFPTNGSQNEVKEDSNNTIDSSNICSPEVEKVVKMAEVINNIETSEAPKNVEIPDSLIPDLIERVRVTTDLNHNMCILTVKAVIECLSERIPEWNTDCSQIIEKLSKSIDNPKAMVLSSDLVNLKSVFRKLWYCKNDEQQRSWPVHRDEDIIKGYLEDLLQIISNANPVFIRDEICGQNYERVHMLVTYFQMETRRSLRMKLYAIFICLISLFEDLICDYFLTSVLPAELTAEMQNYVDDSERWSSAALLFTAIFSTGHKPPINIYSHINEKFISEELNLIEGIDSSGNRIETQISAENSIAPILAFNLHFEDSSDNLVLKALSNRRNASQLTENLVSYLNWEEDITNVCAGRQTNKQFNESKPNSALKLLIEMFANNEVSKLFYYNDVRVIIDIVIRQLNNLPVGDKSIAYYLILVKNIIRNTEYREEPHKTEELIKCLKSIQSHEWSNPLDLQLVSQIKEELPTLFNCL